jgi:hypothetical protein
MLLHELAEPVHGCEFGMLVDRVLIVGDEQPKDVQVILCVRSELRAIEQAVDDFDGPPVLLIAADRARGKRVDQREVLVGTPLGICLYVHVFTPPDLRGHTPLVLSAWNIAGALCDGRPHLECSASRLPSLSRMTARKPCGPIGCAGWSTLPPFASTAATASSSRPCAFR